MKKLAKIAGLVLVAALGCAVVYGGLNSIGSISVLSDRLDDVELAVAEVQGQSDDLSCRVDDLEQAGAAIVTRLNKRVKVDNKELLRQLAYIRGADPTNELAKKTDKEINRLLNDGIWNIEPKITAAYDELIQKAAKHARTAADVAQTLANEAQLTADRADYTARRAVDAGETAISALGEISERKTKPWGRSVTKAAKKSISDQVAEYLERQNNVTK